MDIITLNLGPLHTNCYIIYGDDKRAVVIDPAYSADVIKQAIDKNNLTLEKILLTHAHFDHIMAVDELWGDGVELYVHADDEEMLKNPEYNYMRDYLGMEIEFKTPDRLLNDGDAIPFLNGFIEVIHTPGHTRGSVCYKIFDCMFTGDTLFKGVVGRCDLYGGNYETILESLKKLYDTEGDYKIYPGHGESTTLSEERKNNIYMRYLR